MYYLFTFKDRNSIRTYKTTLRAQSLEEARSQKDMMFKIYSEIGTEDIDGLPLPQESKEQMVLSRRKEQQGLVNNPPNAEMSKVNINYDSDLIKDIHGRVVYLDVLDSENREIDSLVRTADELQKCTRQNSSFSFFYSVIDDVQESFNKLGSWFG
ncbi:hypothetical protein [Legionella shakespearei]|uniref:Uncharacterized protein n=1 Tax=Legionella shakespearei DSM 23087 TaxID=1122169 RepID=A0A0W0YL55_9GAMM|nr:hypothetical protein [Legionella shakespearei]KTD57624.1 hypothetical protein Lsha_2465 [Legionella shakespearei DSM 23087]